jgi:hypothetical protein
VTSQFGPSIRARYTFHAGVEKRTEIPGDVLGSSP